MVVEADKEAKACGILEGDTISAIDDVTMSLKELPWESPLHLKRIHWRLGQKVRVGLIRPGTGRFEVEVELVENPRRYMQDLDHVSVADEKDPVVVTDRQGRIVGWALPVDLDP